MLANVAHFFLITMQTGLSIHCVVIAQYHS